MIKATSVTRNTSGNNARPIATITLDETARHRRRMVLTSDRMQNGATLQFLLDLPQAQLLKNGDCLVLEDGALVEVRAKPESLYWITADNPRHLLALAWQIGNRHLAADIREDHILIRKDHVIRAMLEGLGARISEISAPFDPEGGAYGDPHHGPDHDH